MLGMFSELEIHNFNINLQPSAQNHKHGRSISSIPLLWMHLTHSSRSKIPELYIDGHCFSPTRLKQLKCRGRGVFSYIVWYTLAITARMILDHLWNDSPQMFSCISSSIKS